LLGIAQDGQIANEISAQFENLRKLNGFIIDLPDDAFFDQGGFSDCTYKLFFAGALKVRLDEVITECFANVKTCTVNGITSNHNEVTLGKYFIYETFDSVILSHAGQLLKYIFRVFEATQTLLNSNVTSIFTVLTNSYFKDNDEGTERNVKLFRSRLLSSYLLELRGFSATSDLQETVVAAFVRSMFASELPVNFLQFLIETAMELPNSELVITEVCFNV
jgi:hypothetical protein